MDELPDQVYTRLADGKPFTLDPVPAPTQQELLDEGQIRYDEESGELLTISKPRAEVWARWHGIDSEGLRTYQLSLRDDGLFNNVSLALTIVSGFRAEADARD